MNVDPKPGKRAAETHEVDERCRRFNQKYTAFYQGEWNPRYEGLSKKEYIRSRVEKIERGEPGYSLLDWAYYKGVTTNANATDFVINRPNRGGNTWDEIDRSTFGSERVRTNRWDGDPEYAAKVIKRYSRLVGASDVGICEFDRRWVYSHYYDAGRKKDFPIRFSDEEGLEAHDKPTVLEDGTQVIPAAMKYAIVFVHEMDFDGIDSAPSLTHMATTQLAYSQISFITMSVAEFIRALGYNAIPSANCTAISIPLAIDAGLGELSRSAKLIHPEYGPRCRISKVLTDLPMRTDTPVSFGVRQFCSTCSLCADHCEVNAIPKGEPTYEPVGDYSNEGVLRWQLDHVKCRKYWIETGTNCGVCLKVCPYNRRPSGQPRENKSFWDV